MRDAAETGVYDFREGVSNLDVVHKHLPSPNLHQRDRPSACFLLEIDKLSSLCQCPLRAVAGSSSALGVQQRPGTPAHFLRHGRLLSTTFWVTWTHYHRLSISKHHLEAFHRWMKPDSCLPDDSNGPKDAFTIATKEPKPAAQADPQRVYRFRIVLV
ncbi:hypothetical protein K458DRAFT_385780 [Lentithecium fluviatile CBS 122367]|uniref:Uncharacterized protein n=1 Tax=Lentithecium fluviatile CBS 122367 TaxID=1168545 RepID=A0A6G1JCF6_9PLEO|nr:hypothetical protein K458DRAFT_385780 [Lentithecium fluviatile CBS 122367]